MGDTDALVESAISIDIAAQPDFRTASGFLRSVFNGQERGVVAIFCKPSNVSHFEHLDRPGWHSNAAFTAMQLRDHVNVYFAVGLQGERPEKGRGKEVGVISVPGFWADIDVAGPNHVALALPPTIEDAMGIVQAIPFKPTVIVHTGGAFSPTGYSRNVGRSIPTRNGRRRRRSRKRFRNICKTSRWTAAGLWTAPLICAACCGSPAPTTGSRPSRFWFATKSSVMAAATTRRTSKTSSTLKPTRN